MCACQCALQTTSHTPVTHSCGPGSRAASPPPDLSGPRLKGDSRTDDGASGQEEVEVRPRLSVSPSSFSRRLRLEALSGPAGASCVTARLLSSYPADHLGPLSCRSLHIVVSLTRKTHRKNICSSSTAGCFYASTAASV